MSHNLFYLKRDPQWNGTDAVFRAALDKFVAVGQVNDHGVGGIDHAHQVQFLEEQGGTDFCDVLLAGQGARLSDGADFETGQRGFRLVLGNAHCPGDSSGFCPCQVTGDSMNIRVIDGFHDDLVIGTQHFPGGID